MRYSLYVPTKKMERKLEEEDLVPEVPPNVYVYTHLLLLHMILSSSSQKSHTPSGLLVLPPPLMVI